MGTFSGYTCEKCGTEHRANPSGGYDVQPVHIHVGLNMGYTYKQGIYESLAHQAVWCRPCVIKMGLRKPLSKEDEAVAPKPEPTLVERLEIILREMGFVQHGDLS